MSIKKCTTKEGKPGWQADGGKTCHTGKAGKAKAMREFAEMPAKKAKPAAKAAAPKKKSAKKKA